MFALLVSTGVIHFSPLSPTSLHVLELHYGAQIRLSRADKIRPATLFQPGLFSREMRYYFFGVPSMKNTKKNLENVLTEIRALVADINRCHDDAALSQHSDELREILEPLEPQQRLGFLSTVVSADEFAALVERFNP